MTFGYIPPHAMTTRCNQLLHSVPSHATIRFISNQVHYTRWYFLNCITLHYVDVNALHDSALHPSVPCITLHYPVFPTLLGHAA